MAPHTPCAGKVSLETSLRELPGKEKCIAAMCNPWLEKLCIAQIPTMVAERLHICKLLTLGGSRLSCFKMYHPSSTFTTAVTAFMHRLSTSFTIEM